ncbi:hypothetical protein E0485_24000 [Paenibacillus albiflavus]|uniref:Lipoprotein n=1 Tax=Paenibacillus albiflavus TaxID=2545760 RepID=A0A4R4E253_9BACL|nr:hypothetical protein [Paenibacillus albiflavus]TCZ69134.1 hypothetical protein E0485_24000 [Paenibacillus albiflavus]
MKRIRKPLFFTIFLSILITFTVSCSNDEKNTPNDIDNIRLEMTEQREDQNGMIYTLRLQNKSKQVIKQNNVYLSFPIKIENGWKGNEFKIEAKNNKLNIKPGEEILLSVTVPSEMYKGINNIDLKNPNIEIKGYINEVTELNQFHIGGGYQAMIGF